MKKLIFLLFMILMPISVFLYGCGDDDNPFKTDPTDENQPNTPVPSNSSSNIATDVTLRWSCEVEDGQAHCYDVYFGTTPNPGRVAREINATTFTRNNLEQGTRYYWKIRNCNNDVTSNLWNFTTRSQQTENHIPNNPTPSNGADNIDTDVNLRWNCDLGTGQTHKYDVYFGSTSNPGRIASNITTTSYTKNDLQEGTTYYWKIKNLNDNVFSDVWSFTTEEGSNPSQSIVGSWTRTYYSEGTQCKVDLSFSSSGSGRYKEYFYENYGTDQFDFPYNWSINGTQLTVTYVSPCRVYFAMLGSWETLNTPSPETHTFSISGTSPNKRLVINGTTYNED